MTMRKMMIPAMVVAMMISCAALVSARQGPPAERPDEMAEFDNPQAPGGEPSEERREEVRKKIEAVRIWRLTEALKLDAPTSSKLSALLSSFDQQRRDIMREQMTTMRQLRHILDSPKPDESKIKTVLDRLEKNQRAMQALRDKEFGGVKEILTIEQQARFLLFQQEFRREMQGMIANARRGGPGPRGGLRGEGPGRPQDR
jgi:Spy/CpxP family protein refolding chaperone